MPKMKPMTPPSLDQLRYALTKAHTSAPAFEETLQSISSALGANSAMAFVPSNDVNAGFAVDMLGWRTHELHALGQVHAADVGQVDPWRIAAQKMGGLTRPLIATSEDLVPAAEFARSDWGPFFHRLDVDHLLSCATPPDRIGAPLAVVSFYRAANQGPFGSAERALLQAIAHDLSAVASVRLRLGPILNLTDTGLALIAEPAFLISRGGVVTGLNEPALVLAQAGDLLRIEANALIATHDHLRDAVQTLILKALRGQSGVINLIRTTHRHLALRASPISLGDQLVALIRVCDLRAAPKPLSHDLCALFGLSKAEAEVAIAMTDFLTARAIAKRRGTDVETVRTQMRRVFEKLGVRRASEAITIILRVAE